MAPRRRQRSAWPDLQPELLGLVLARLPSLADRVRLRAVCRSWRRGARLAEPPPPPFPWLTRVDGTFLTVPGGEIHRVLAPENVSCHGSVGSWLFLLRPTGQCLLKNPFSGDVVRLPNLEAIWYHPNVDAFPGSRPVYFKLASPSPRDVSPGSLFVVLIVDSRLESVISICRPPIATAFRVPNFERVADIAFFDGKLYALSYRKLSVIEIDSSYEGPPMKCIPNSVDDSGTPLRRFRDGNACSYQNYLVESDGRLLHVRRFVEVPRTVPTHERRKYARTLSFQVFEADLTAGSCVQWRRVNSLGDKALFVSKHSKSLTASECGAKEDCIYFMDDYDRVEFNADDFHDCGVFNIRNGIITPLLPETAAAQQLDEWVITARSAWFFPNEAM